MFNFRIIYDADGTDVIDTTLKTPYSSLTHAQMEDYIEMDKKLAYMERMKEKERKKMEHKRKVSRNLLYRVVCGNGMGLFHKMCNWYKVYQNGGTNGQY